MNPEDVWASEEKAEEWLNKTNSAYSKNDLSADYIIHKLKEVEFESILEVGSGNGRIISKIKKTHKEKFCCALDINDRMVEFVNKTYAIKTIVSDVCDINLHDDEFDIVYTFQVLQHVQSSRIHKAIKELKRVAAKEVWLIEGFVEQYYRKDKKYKTGIKTHSVDGGSYAYYYDDMDVGVYYSELAVYKTWNTGKIKLYKIKP